MTPENTQHELTYLNAKQGPRMMWNATGLTITTEGTHPEAPPTEIPWDKVDEMRCRFAPVDSGKVTTKLTEFLLATASEFKNAPREGAFTDEPEGSRYIQISDRAATHLTEQLDLMARLADPFALPDALFRAYANQVAAEVRHRMALQKP